MGHNGPKYLHLYTFRQAQYCGFKGFTIICRGCLHSVFRTWRQLSEKWDHAEARDYEAKCVCSKCGQRNATISFEGAEIGDWVCSSRY